MTRRLNYAIIPLFPALLGCAATMQESGPALALDQVRIINVEEGRASGPQCVRIESDRIVRITRSGTASCRRNADVHELNGRWLMPGLIDTHAHLTLGPLEFRRERGRAIMAAEADDEIADHNAARLAAFGVTTIRNPGGDLSAASRYKARRATGAVIGPESFDAGPVINNADLPGLATRAGDTAQIREVVAAQVARGADWIKLYTGLSPELLEAGIRAAHAHGRPAVAHLDAVPWTDALEMGLDALVHLMPISPALLEPEQRAAWQANARPGTFAFFEWWEHFDPDGPGADRLVAAFETYKPAFDATLVAFHAAFVQDLENPYREDARRYAHPRLLANWDAWFTFAAGWEPADFERARAVWPKVQRLTRRLYATRARVTVGTDMSNPWIAPGISMHREMQLLAEAGVPATTVLTAATWNAAETLGAADRLGRVAPGFEADLLILDANPLDDIANTRAIQAVILDGRFLDTNKLDELKGELE